MYMYIYSGRALLDKLIPHFSLGVLEHPIRPAHGPSPLFFRGLILTCSLTADDISNSVHVPGTSKNRGKETSK